MTNDDELQRLRQENHTLREGLKQALMAIDFLQERIKELERTSAKDSHNSSLPPSSDRFSRPPKSLRQKSGKQAGGQKGHQGHHLRQRKTPDAILIHTVERCEACQHDLREQPAEQPEGRQVIDLPVLRVWVTEHRVEEKRCPVCSHRTRAVFPRGVNAVAQYGKGIEALAVSLVEGQAVPMLVPANSCRMCWASSSRQAALPALSERVTESWPRWKPSSKPPSRRLG